MVKAFVFGQIVKSALRGIVGQFSRGIMDRSISAIFKSQLQLFYNLLYRRHWQGIQHKFANFELTLRQIRLDEKFAHSIAIFL